MHLDLRAAQGNAQIPKGKEEKKPFNKTFVHFFEMECEFESTSTPPQESFSILQVAFAFLAPPHFIPLVRLGILGDS